MTIKLWPVVKSAPDARDFIYRPIATVTAGDILGIMPYLTPIEDQAQEGSCTAHGSTSTCETLTKRAGRFENLSRQLMYHESRLIENRLGQEGVQTLRSVMQAGSKIGFALESEWGYFPGNEETTPPQSVYDSAATRKITRYEFLPINPSNTYETIDTIKSALSEGLPVIIAFYVYAPIFDLHGPLAQQNYQTYDAANARMYPLAGAHCVEIVGYKADGDYFIYANSWTKDWGDNGLGAFPARFVGDIFEATVVRGFNGIEIKRQGEVMPITMKLAAIADAHGRVVVPHGIPSLQDKLLRADATYHDPVWYSQSGAIRPMSFTFCDSGSICFDAAGAANCPVSICFDYQG